MSVTTLDAPVLGPHRPTVLDLTVAGVLCGCGDLIGATRYPGAPARDNGSDRGQCECFRRRRRETPVGSCR